eukprot:259055-Pyramimonas_sp.AAC.1
MRLSIQSPSRSLKEVDMLTSLPGSGRATGTGPAAAPPSHAAAPSDAAACTLSASAFFLPFRRRSVTGCDEPVE